MFEIKMYTCGPIPLEYQKTFTNVDQGLPDLECTLWCSTSGNLEPCNIVIKLTLQKHRIGPFPNRWLFFTSKSHFLPLPLFSY